jgi:hypothetical protein
MQGQLIALEVWATGASTTIAALGVSVAALEAQIALVTAENLAGYVVNNVV